MNTDLEYVKRKTMMIARIVQPEADPVFPFITIHPFLESPFWFEKMHIDKVQGMDSSYDLTNPEIYEKWLEAFQQRLDKIDNLSYIYMLWRSSWKMTFMKFCGPYLSEKDYATYLAESWIDEENPNMDANVSISESIKMFKKCKKEDLMCEEDLNYYKSLPDQLTVYRGVAQGRVKIGLSWTDDLDQAKWFQHRFGEENTLLQLNVQKKDIIAYFNTRNEKEILLDVLKYKKQILAV